MRKLILFIFAIGLVLTIFAVVDINSKSNLTETAELNNSSKEKIESKILEVQKLVKKDSKYNSEIGFFIDMKIHSGKNRFLIYNLRTEKIIDKGLVAHGSGSETGVAGKLKFSK